MGDAGIFAGDQIDAGQRLQRAQRDVGKVPDRRRYQIETGNRFWRIQDVAVQRKSLGRRTRFPLRPVY
jgi:hypothetical protein